MERKKNSLKRDTLKKLANDLGVSYKTVLRKKSKGQLNDFIIEKKTQQTVIAKTEAKLEAIKDFNELQSELKSKVMILLNNLTEGVLNIDFNELNDRDKADIAVKLINAIAKIGS